MNKFAIATVFTGAVAAAVIGLAGPANAAVTVLDPSVSISADISNHRWISDLQPSVNVPQVDTSVHAGR